MLYYCISGVIICFLLTRFLSPTILRLDERLLGQVCKSGKAPCPHARGPGGGGTFPWASCPTFELQSENKDLCTSTQTLNFCDSLSLLNSNAVILATECFSHPLHTSLSHTAS